MRQIKLQANIREKTGKQFCKKIRKGGFIPGVIYGKRIKPINLSVSMKEVVGILKKNPSALIELNLEENKDGVYFAIIKEVQRDYLTDDLLSVSFYHISLDEVLTTSVPVRLVGEAIGVKEGGILEQISREIEIECLPVDIPNEIEVDISNLRIGHSIHLKDIKLDKKIKILASEDTVIATIIPPEEETKEEVAVSTPTEPEIIRKKEKDEKDEK